jgi:negative regulator of flagellin synthesis FlgM
MSNIIDGNSTLRGAELAGNRKPVAKPVTPAESNPASQTSTSSAGDNVTLSSTPNLLKSVRETIENTPAVDMNKVEMIKQQISAGEYPINPDRIASKMMDLERLIS